MNHNKELNRSMAAEASGRERRQAHLSTEVAALTTSIESNIAELGAISDQVLAASPAVLPRLPIARRAAPKAHVRLGRSLHQSSRHRIVDR